MVDPFLKEIDAFLDAQGLTEHQLGRLALNDKRFVSEIRSGKRSPTLKTVEKLRHYMLTYRREPKDAAA